MGKASRKASERSSPRAAVAGGSGLAAALWSHRGHLAAIGAIWLLALIAYSNSFGAGLVRDNTAQIRDDPRIQAATAQNIELIFNQEYWYGNSITQLYRPLTTLSFLFNYTILGGGTRVTGYHWVNFALHALNIVLVYLLTLYIFRRTSWALAATAVWAVHPVLTESVTNLVGRADLLAALGMFAGLLCHIRASRAPGRGKLAWLGGLTVAVAVGMFSKESAIVVLGVMLLHDVAFEPPRGWRSTVAGYAAAALPCLVFLYRAQPRACALGVRQLRIHR